MSFVPGTSLSINILRQPDKSCAERDDEIIAQPPTIIEFMSMDVCSFERGTWQTAWWPNSSNLMGWDGTDTHLLMVPAAFSWPWITLGCNGRFSLAGTARDQYGTALPFAVLRLFLTSDGTMVSMVTADGNGAFIITSPYNTAHFLTVHKDGTVAGASVDTLLPG